MKNIRVVTDVAESFSLFTIVASTAATCLPDVRTILCSSRLFISLLRMCIVCCTKLPPLEIVFLSTPRNSLKQLFESRSNFKVLILIIYLNSHLNFINIFVWMWLLFLLSMCSNCCRQLDWYCRFMNIYLSVPLASWLFLICNDFGLNNESFQTTRISIPSTILV